MNARLVIGCVLLLALLTCGCGEGGKTEAVQAPDKLKPTAGLANHSQELQPQIVVEAVQLMPITGDLSLPGKVQFIRSTALSSLSNASVKSRTPSSVSRWVTSAMEIPAASSFCIASNASPTSSSRLGHGCPWSRKASKCASTTRTTSMSRRAPATKR